VITRVAAIDCGTNSIRMLIADVDAAAGTLADVDRRMEIIRLGEGVDRTGEFAPAALRRTFAACGRYADTLAAHGVNVSAARLRFVATSASRDVSNRAVFADGVTAIFGVAPEVITGDTEAELSFVGSTRELLGDARVSQPYLVVDIGGGSTEFVTGTTTVTAAKSVDIGCVRMAERHLRGDPASAAEVAAAISDIDGAIALAAAAVPLAEAQSLVGLAGSVTTIAAIAAGLKRYDSALIHHRRISAEEVHHTACRLMRMTRAERGALPVIHPGRVDVIGAGAVILDRVIQFTGASEVLVSEHDILDGIVWSLAS
jgi:exopolyphosphatase / guanosine-5'-triphosphate,3'-diphosphate pyrophosphatase